MTDPVRAKGPEQVGHFSSGSSIKLPDTMANFFVHPPAVAKPWVFWYCMQDGSSKERVRKDLEAMRSMDIGGAYLIPGKEGLHPSFLRRVFKEAGQYGFILHDGDEPTGNGALGEGPVYDRQEVQIETLTGPKITWDGYSDSLKTRQDRNYAMGVNKLIFHAFIHHPHIGRYPEMTLDGVGLNFQKDSGFGESAKAWIQYTHRCEWLLQQGRRVADIAVFTGEELSRRFVLPDDLIGTLPGIFGKEAVSREAKRLINKEKSKASTTSGLDHSRSDPEDWVDPLHGYAYDCMNPDVLLRLATVDKGQVMLPGGGRYSVLVLPGATPLSPNPALQSAEVAERLLELVQDGATLLINDDDSTGRTGGAAAGVERSGHVPGLLNSAENDKRVTAVHQQLLGGVFRENGHSFWMSNVGKGRVIKGPFRGASFDGIGLEKDLIAMESDYQWAGTAPPNDTAAEIVIPALKKATGLAYTHRTGPAMDIYFVSNQQNKTRIINLSLRITGKQPELWNAVTGEITRPEQWSQHGNRTVIPVRLEANGSLFVVFRRRIFVLSADQAGNLRHRPTDDDNTVTDNIDLPVLQTLTGPWELRWDTAAGGPAGPVIFDSLQDWSRNADSAIRYYSGTAVYTKDVMWRGAGQAGSGKAGSDRKVAPRIWLDLGHVANIAQVSVNGIDCGVAWTPPYRVEITSAIKPGNNRVVIEVTNTWANRLIGDHLLPEDKRITWTTAPYRLDGKLLEAGLLGPVTIRGAEPGR